MAAEDRTYFRKLGISEDIVDLMVSTEETRILTEPELLKLRLATEVKEGHEVVYGYKDGGGGDRAIADHSKAIEINPNAHSYLNRGADYDKKGEYDRAIADYSKAIEIDPKYAFAYNNRAMAYFTAGKPAQGLPDVEKSLELHPDDPAALETRGLIFEALGRKEKAIADFRRALAIAPNLQSSKDALKRLGALGTP
jgi:tetratricopeptide (TPR) repeat protein